MAIYLHNNIKMKKMRKQNLFTIATLVAIISISFFTTSCGSEEKVYDESGYVGTYYGKHFLADSAFIRGILQDPTANMMYDDTLVITNGTDNTDGKLIAKSKLLGNADIEFDISNNNVSPTFLGNISVLGTTLKNTKLTSGTGVWNTDKTALNTNLVATVTYTYNSSDIELPGIKINGQFTKQ